jgi:hypothetical protein
VPKFLGTINQRFRPRYGEPAKAFQKWIDRINHKVTDRLVPALDKAGMMLGEDDYEGATVNADPFSLANIADFNSLIAKSQDFGVPVFELSDAQLGLAGDLLRITKESRDSFHHLFKRLAKSIAKMTGATPPTRVAAKKRAVSKG